MKILESQKIFDLLQKLKKREIDIVDLARTDVLVSGEPTIRTRLQTQLLLDGARPPRPDATADAKCYRMRPTT